MRATRLIAIATAALAATVSFGALAAAPEKLEPVTVKGERIRTEGTFCPFVYEALGATPRVTFAGFAGKAAPTATAATPFVYDRLGATPKVALPVREQAVSAEVTK